MRRFLPVIIFTGLLSVIAYYLGMRLAENSFQWALIILSMALIWSLPIIHWRSEKDEASLAALISIQASFFAMGFLSWLFVYSVGRDAIIGLVWALGDFEKALALNNHSGGSVAFVITLSLSFIGGWWATRGPRLKKVDVSMPHLPDSFKGLTIAQVSDLHIGPLLGSRYVKKVLKVIENSDPHVVVFTGDIVDGNVDDLKHVLQEFKPLTALKPVYYSPGNHEYYWEFHKWAQEFEAHGFRILLNKGNHIEIENHGIWIGGITDPAAEQFKHDAPNPQQAATGSDNAHLKVLLSHRPHFADAAHKAGFHLQLSGHTHGGQFFPWTFVAKLFHKYFVGLYKHEDMWVYVSPGTGFWGPPVRLGTTPEVSVIQIIGR